MSRRLVKKIKLRKTGRKKLPVTVLSGFLGSGTYQLAGFYENMASFIAHHMVCGVARAQARRRCSTTS